MVQPPVITFDEDIFEVDFTDSPVGQWGDFSVLVYALEGRGKSTFLKSVMEAWGKKSIVAMDMEGRLNLLGVPRVTLPDLTDFPPETHYARLLAWWDILLDRAEVRAAPFSPETRVIAMDTFNTYYDKLHDADLERHYAGKNIPRAEWKYPFTWYDSLYADLFKHWRRMNRLVNHGYSIIINAHVKRTKRKINGEDIDQFEPALPPALVQVMNREAYCIFYLQASAGDSPNYFVTSPVNDTIPAKDQTGKFPRRFWPTWSAVEAIQLGKPWVEFKPTGIKFEVKKEAKK